MTILSPVMGPDGKQFHCPMCEAVFHDGDFDIEPEDVFLCPKCGELFTVNADRTTEWTSEEFINAQKAPTPRQKVLKYLF